MMPARRKGLQRGFYRRGVGLVADAAAGNRRLVCSYPVNHHTHPSMNALATPLLLAGMLALTASCLFGHLTPLGWIALYGGWMFLLQHVGRRLLADVRRESAPVPVPVRTAPPQRRSAVR